MEGGQGELSLLVARLGGWVGIAVWWVLCGNVVWAGWELIASRRRAASEKSEKNVGKKAEIGRAPGSPFAIGARKSSPKVSSM